MQLRAEYVFMKGTQLMQLQAEIICVYDTEICSGSGIKYWIYSTERKTFSKEFV